MIRICSHRGNLDSSSHRENSLAAYREVIANGIDMIELDVHQTSDGVWIVNHDRHIEGLEIKTQRLDALSSEIGDQNLTLLADVLEDVNVHLNIECKPKKAEDGRSLGMFLTDYNRDDYNISSFSAKTLKGFHPILPAIDLSYLGIMLPRIKWAWLHRSLQLFSINPFYVALKKGNVEKAHQKGIEVHVWTPNKEEDIRKVINLGVDVIITDYPVRATKVRDQIMKSSQ
ncbi:MAG: glycerophosphodiester phosphodiesterase [Candidatus Kariarchaeaceae archaeon]|jgi:glycerophosphoryl diester phosphodiesterase